ncbi:transcription initiation factor IID, 31kD subunit-domain-containing protein [Schizophyllum fasciatum]
MSRPVDSLPPTARSIALLLSSTPGVQDVQPGVLHQLLEFSHRYTQQVLTDAQMYAEHAGRAGKVELDDVVLSIQARVGWEFGGRVPKEYILSLANQTNSVPLPSVPEVFGVRLPSDPDDTLTGINFDLVPNRPPPGVKIYDEEIEEIEESEEEDEGVLEAEEDDVDMEGLSANPHAQAPQPPPEPVEEAPFPISAFAAATPNDISMATPGDAGSDAGEDGDLFGDEGEPEDGDLFGEDKPGEPGAGEDEDEAMEEVAAPTTNGVARQFVEEDDYD